MIRAAFYLAAFYLVYSLFLSRDTLYRRNRIYILAAVASAFVLPLITIHTSRPINLFAGRTLNEVLVTGTGYDALAPAAENRNHDISGIMMVIYLSGLGLFALKFLMDMTELLILVLKNRTSVSNVIRFSGLNTAGFSALGYVFINSALPEEDEKEILRHEQNHLDNFHFLDIIFMEIIRAFQWFNPFIHLFDRSLRAVHEFEADEGCLKTGIPVVIYQRLIMSQVFRTKAFNVINSFSNPTLIKKRMIMMTKERSRMLANLKLLMVLPVIAVVMIAFSSCKGKTTASESTTEEIAPPPPPPPPAVSTDQAEEPYTVVEEMPLFPGGDPALIKFVAENTKYPENAKTNGITGRVIVRFVVEKDGSVGRAGILQGVDPELDAEALRVAGLIPKFEKPGMQGGKAVPVWYALPITFALQ